MSKKFQEKYEIKSNVWKNQWFKFCLFVYFIDQFEWFLACKILFSSIESLFTISIPEVIVIQKRESWDSVFQREESHCICKIMADEKVMIYVCYSYNNWLSRFVHNSLSVTREIGFCQAVSKGAVNLKHRYTHNFHSVRT